MAGIGFELSKLTRQRNLIGVAGAYFHSTMIIAGPWLMTALCIGLISYAAKTQLPSQQLSVFRLFIIYNFGFSLVLAGPIIMVVTRCLADRLYARQLDSVCSMLVGAMLLIVVSQLPLVSFFYFTREGLSDSARIAAIINYMTIAIIWLVMVFLTALKAYRLVSMAFIVGLSVALLVSLMVAPFASLEMITMAFSSGLVLVVCILLAGVFSEYPNQWSDPFWFIRYFKSHWELALAGLIYNMAIWVDKWVMWFSPEAVEIVAGMPSYPIYDSAMFYSFITIIPSLSIFVLNLETRFFERYLKFFRDIKQHASLDKINNNHRDILKVLKVGARNVFVIQVAVSASVILSTPAIIEYIGASYAQVGILRFGVLGGMFHVFQALMLIVIYYFDYRRVALVLVLLYLLMNLLFTLASVELGFPYYGMGFFFSALVSFLLTAMATVWCIENVPYYTFIGHNPSVVK